MGEHSGDIAPADGEILPPPARARPDPDAPSAGFPSARADGTLASSAKALVGRLVRGGDVSPALLTLVDGPLADAVSKAADYAGKSIAPGTVATYKADWSDFAQSARQQGVDPTALPVHPVVVAAWLATLGRSALRRRIAAVA